MYSIGKKSQRAKFRFSDDSGDSGERVQRLGSRIQDFDYLNPEPLKRNATCKCINRVIILEEKRLF
jgi:hypothetical protein